jgi:hypothetical protein
MTNRSSEQATAKQRLKEELERIFVLTIHNGLLGVRHKKIHTHTGLALLLGTNIWGKHVLVTSCLPIGQ